MKNVTIRRCPTCSNIGGHSDQLAAELQKDPNVRVNVVDGAKGEFKVDVDGRSVNSMAGESLRDVSDLSADIRGAKAGAV